MVYIKHSSSAKHQETLISSNLKIMESFLLRSSPYPWLSTHHAYIVKTCVAWPAFPIDHCTAEVTWLVTAFAVVYCGVCIDFFVVAEPAVAVRAYL
jgi:hypothetical protein